MHLKFDDYLQIKLKKLTGEIGDKFEYLHFSKRSVLVSIATNSSRDLFAPQSSFVLGYMCISKCYNYKDYNYVKSRFYSMQCEIL